MNNYAQRYYEHEDWLIESFAGSPCVGKIADLSREGFISFLLQTGHISDRFVWWLQRILHCLNGQEARAVVRSIMDDEIPAGWPTHQDNRRHDLVELMGVPIERFLQEKPTQETREATWAMWTMGSCPSHSNADDLSLLCAFRMFGELLVGETYEAVCHFMTSRELVKESSSRFYVPHRNEDRKARKGGHASIFQSYLEKHICDEASFRAALAGANLGFRARLNFQGQFRRTSRLGSFLRLLCRPRGE
jgi:hypothetical protein